MKFKVGDKVKILPSAVNGGVSESSVGKTGTVIEYCKPGNYFLVCMNDSKSPLPWAVDFDQIELVIKVGQQLLLWEDM